MADQNGWWVLMLLGAGLTTWLLVSSTAHLRDNAGPALNEMGREVEVSVAERELQHARERAVQARQADPFDPEQAQRAMQAAVRALEEAAERMETATPEQQKRLEEQVRKLEKAVETLAARMAKPGT